MGGECAVPCRHGEQSAAVLAHRRDADQRRVYRRRHSRWFSARVRAGHRAGGPGSEGGGAHPPPARRPKARPRSTRGVDRHGERRRAASTCLKPTHRCGHVARPRRRRPSHPSSNLSAPVLLSKPVNISIPSRAAAASQNGVHPLTVLGLWLIFCGAAPLRAVETLLTRPGSQVASRPSRGRCRRIPSARPQLRARRERMRW